MERYFLKENDETIGYVDYDLFENELRINKVYVMPSFRGQGKAQILMENILEYSQKNGLKAIPICSYAISYFEKNKLN